MKFRLSRKQGTTVIILLLIALSICPYLIGQGFESNIRSYEKIRTAKEHQIDKEYWSSIYWYGSAYSTALISGMRWEVFKVFNNRVHTLREEGNLDAALSTCRIAAKIWNQEGTVNIECSSIEQELSKSNQK